MAKNTISDNAADILETRLRRLEAIFCSLRYYTTIGSDAHGDPDEMTKLLVGAGKRAVSEALKALQQNQLLRTDRTSRWGM